ncbi:hypothetical protein LUZ61_014796 [Rhynchospora tenuis]|uniref:Protein kinase domain-containing protein n=1 Tax=Rhynchospora tenuis TaxID=198213 RepID=A0AAD5WBS0_9POAL|nr:hypothetical protein LUZ61_014796 [Rhynchospora tenuis]
MLFTNSPILFFFLHTITITIGIVYGKTCPLCGTKPVPYPLSTNSTCGDRSYKIRCNNDTSTLIFDSLNNSYTITSISASNQRLTIAPAALLGDSCISSDLNTNGLELDPSLPFKITIGNTLMLYNCTPSILLSPLNCSQNALCHVYANNSGSEIPFCNYFPNICCTLLGGGSSMSYSIRINPESCSLYRSFVNLDVRQPVDMWENKTGVELQWTLPREPICETQADCEDGKNATCSPDPTSSDESVKRCFCIDSFFWDPISGMCVQNETNCEIMGTCKESNRGPFIAGLASGLGGAVLVSAVGILVYIRHQCIHRRRERLKKEREEFMNLNNTSGRSTKSYTGREMKRATNNFSRNNLLGSGGFGEVYKGVLQDGTLIAVKCAKLGNTKSTDQVLNEVSDFGLSRLIESEDLTHITTCAQGTLGYVDPEYYRNFQLTDKSDVYSFGVVLLEILTAQKAIDFRRPADDVNLAVYILRLVEEERLIEALDPAIMKIATQVEIDTMQAIGFLAVSCLEEKRQNRPSMKEVTEEIEYIITLLNGSSFDQTVDIGMV